ncbi:MAG: hypothetical protein JJU35_12105 [Balneolales bacterium]|nr:hypothetical protein [Balneolales bacterium]
MNNRHQKLGIKQTIQLNWMDRTLEMLLSGMKEQEIRAELHAYISHQKQSGGYGLRGSQTYGMAVSILGSWFAPEKRLLPFRDFALELARSSSSEYYLPLHWAVLSASYPFWFGVAQHTGRLLNFQEIITQKQIFGRVKEQYGDRETVARNARYAVRSFVAWGVLSDQAVRGNYGKEKSAPVSDPHTTVLLYEAALHATDQSSLSLAQLINNPGLFPFSLPAVTEELLRAQSERIEVSRMNLDDLRLRLKPGS